MAIVKSGFGSNLLTVDSTSKAMRVTDVLTNGGGCASVVKVGSYMAGINVRTTATVTPSSAGVFVWAFLNKTPYNVRIRSIRITSAFDGTAGTTDYGPCLSFCQIAHAKFTNGAMTTAGRKSTRHPHSSAEIWTSATGLTFGSGYAPALCEIFNVEIRQGATGTVTSQVFCHGLDKYWDKYIIGPNMGIGAYFVPNFYRGDALASYPAGIGMYGCIEWDEVSL